MAKTLVLLRGLARGKLHWGDFLTRVEKTFPEKCVVAIDLAGNGLRFQESSPVSIEDAVEDIRQQLMQANISPPYEVLGLSLGGMISLQWLMQYPHELEKVVVMNTSHAGLSLPWERLQPLSLLKMLTTLFLPTYYAESFIYAITSNNNLDKDVITYWSQLRKNQPVSLRNVIRQIKIARTFNTPLNPLTHKLMPQQDKITVLASLNDRMVNVECSKKIALALKAKIVFHPSAGHEISLDDAEWVLKSISE